MAEQHGEPKVEHPLVSLARRAVEHYLAERAVIPAPVELAPEMLARAGVFVSIKKRGELRGCIGTFEPTRANVAEEIVYNAISAATRDPRFPPIALVEVAWLSYSVDVLAPPESITDIGDLDVRRYGVIVAKGGRRGLLLPDLAGVETPEQQVAIACMKAGIALNQSFDMLRFEVRRYH